MANILELTLTKEDYLEIARKAAEDGRVEKAIINLNKALRLDGKYIDASLALSNIYNSINDISMANKVLFEALSKVDNKKDEIECYNKLAYNHIDVKDFKTAEYYIYKCDGAFVFPESGLSPEDFEEPKAGYSLYDKDSDEENVKLLEKAYEALRDRNIDQVVLLADKISEKSPQKKNADYLVLITLMLQENFQSVIDNALLIIEKRGESLQILCTLATAYWLIDNKQEAYKVIDHILEKKYTKEEDVLQLIPLLINTNMHVNVVQYTKFALEQVPYQRDIMMWCAEALYNIGQVAESKKMFNSIKNIFNDKAVDYYLQEIEHKKEILEYAISLPQSEKIRRIKLLQDLVKTTNKKLKGILEEKEIQDIIEWVVEENNTAYLRAIEVLVRNLPRDIKDDIIKKHLIDQDMGFDKIISLFTYLVELKQFDYEFNIVAQGRFKHIKMTLPSTYFVMPNILQTATTIAICEIVQADEQANDYLIKLVNGLNNALDIIEDEIVPKHCTLLQLKRIKDVEILVGVLIANTYKDDAVDFGVEKPGDFAINHGLDAKKFEKYYTMLYGEKYEY